MGSVLVWGRFLRVKNLSLLAVDGECHKCSVKTHLIQERNAGPLHSVTSQSVGGILLPGYVFSRSVAKRSRRRIFSNLFTLRNDCLNGDARLSNAAFSDGITANCSAIHSCIGHHVNLTGTRDTSAAGGATVTHEK